MVKVGAEFARVVFPKLIEDSTPFVLLTLDGKNDDAKEDSFSFNIKWSGDILEGTPDQPNINNLIILLESAVEHLKSHQ